MQDFQLTLVSDYSSNQGLPAYLYRAFIDTISAERVVFVGEEERTYSTRIYTRAKRKIDIYSGKLSAIKSQRVRQALDNKKKNIVIFFNTSGLNTNDLKNICSLPSVFSIHYCSDHPYGMFSPNREITLQTVPFFDLIITMAEQLKPVFYQLGAKWVERLPFGYCKYTHLLPSENLNIEFPDKVFYFGTWTAEIESWVEPLLAFNLEIEGTHWFRAKNNRLKEIALNGPLKADTNMAIAARKAGVVVNFTRSSHGCFHTMKTFELAIAGAAVVSNYSEEQAEFFADDICYKYFNTKNEMLGKVDYFLSNPSSALLMRDNCKKAALPHSYHLRVAQLLNILKKKNIISE